VFTGKYAQVFSRKPFEFLLEQEREKTKQAEQKGLQEGVIKVARNLLEKGFDVETITQVSGLSREDVETLL
jgi:predicted transposase/invertase (TIGR01784 family)